MSSTIRIESNALGALSSFVKDTKEEETKDVEDSLSGKNHPNWLDLPDQVIALIFSRLDPVKVLERAPRVCTTWRRICKQKYIMWHTIQIQNFGSDRLLNYITSSCNGIRRLKIVASKVTPKGLSEVASELPLLEDLEISYWGHTHGCHDYTHQLKMSYCTMAFGCLEVIGRSCPLLKSLKLNTYKKFFKKPTGDVDALAIAKTMPGLHHLQLIENGLSLSGLREILKCCPHLESLDLRGCSAINGYKNSDRKVLESLKTFRRGFVLDDYEHISIHKLLEKEHDAYLDDIDGDVDFM